MAQVDANGMRIEYECFGDPGAEAMLLVMGLGRQLISWDAALCRQLASEGYRVIRFDNRDVGLSTSFRDSGKPDFGRILGDVAAGKTPAVAYTIEDMADDAVALLTALGIERAHVVGASLGGMIAQTIAIRHPSRVLSLTSMMSHTGRADLPRARPEVAQRLMTPPEREPQARIAQMAEMRCLLAGGRYPADPAQARRESAEEQERGPDISGVARQLAAILAQGSREPGLRALSVPTLVLHGADDPLIPVECGRITAEVIPDARLEIIEGWGHDLPEALFPCFVESITAHAAAATEAARAPVP